MSLALAFMNAPSKGGGSTLLFLVAEGNGDSSTLDLNVGVPGLVITCRGDAGGVSSDVPLLLLLLLLPCSLAADFLEDNTKATIPAPITPPATSMLTS